MKTKIYHITYHKNVRSLSLYFHGCNFMCKTCIRNETIWDIHLNDNIKRNLMTKDQFLSLSELKKLISEFSINAEKAILEGYEPTLDNLLPEIIKILVNNNIEPILLTNGYLLSNFMNTLKNSGLERIQISIKTVNPELHKKYTGTNVYPVLNNFIKAYEKGFNLSAESVYVPNISGLMHTKS